MTRWILSLGAALAVAVAGLATVFMSSAPQANAEVLALLAQLSAAKAEGAMPGATGSGTGYVTYNTTTNELSWNITWSGTQGTTTVAHFHGPAAQGTPAVITVPIADVTSPSFGTATITEPQEAELLANLWYINVHTTHSPGGEIRGQVLGSVGGIAVLVDGSPPAVQSAEAASSGNAPIVAGAAAAVAAAFAAVIGVTWYARRRASSQ